MRNQMVEATKSNSTLSSKFATVTGNVIYELIKLVANAYGLVMGSITAQQKIATRLGQQAKGGNDGWVINRLKEFRWDAANNRGYAYSLDAEGFVEYTAGANDPDALLITACAIQNDSGTAIIKLAKGQPGSLTRLSNDELSAVIQYASDRVRRCGTAFAYTSRFADSVRVTCSVYANALFGLSNVNNAVLAAINTYVSTGITFGGAVNRTKLLEAILAVDGVIDVSDLVIQTKPASASTWRTVNRQANLDAGYAVSVTTLENITIIPSSGSTN